MFEIIIFPLWCRDRGPQQGWKMTRIQYIGYFLNPLMENKEGKMMVVVQLFCEQLVFFFFNSS